MLLLTDERSAQLWHQVHGMGRGTNVPVPLLPGHSPLCSLVLVKTSTFLFANYEHTAKLKYELALHSRMQAALDCAQPRNNTRATHEGSSSSLPQGERAANLPHVSDHAQPQSGHANGIRPHIRALADSRLALILPDLGGVLLRTIMMQRNSHGDSADSNSSPPSTLLSALAVPFSVQRVTHALRLTLSVSEQLSALHAAGLVHKSLHPDNVTINEQSGAAQWLDLTAASVLATDRASADYNYHLHPPSVWQVRQVEAVRCRQGIGASARNSRAGVALVRSFS